MPDTRQSFGVHINFTCYHIKLYQQDEMRINISNAQFSWPPNYGISEGIEIGLVILCVLSKRMSYIMVFVYKIW